MYECQRVLEFIFFKKKKKVEKAYKITFFKEHRKEHIKMTNRSNFDTG